MESHSQSTIDSNCSETQATSTELNRDAKFLEMLPKIRRQAAYYLRHVSKKDRAEAIQEVVACAFVSYLRLIERGKADLAYAGPLARYGAYQYFGGRRVGNSMNGHDVSSDYCQRRKGIMVEQLDRYDDLTSEWEQFGGRRDNLLRIGRSDPANRRRGRRFSTSSSVGDGNGPVVLLAKQCLQSRQGLPRVG
jgi:hypothetical protein